MGKPQKKQNQKSSAVNPVKQKRNQEAERQKQQLELEKQRMPQECPDGVVNLQFTPIDTWFFRESRPHDAVGASVLSSLFPPPIKTLIGTVRSFLGDSIEINWKTLISEIYPDFNFTQALGNNNGLGKLSVRGAWVCKENQRLYPAPFYLMHKDEDFMRLQIGDKVECDLGNVRLPELPKGNAGYKGLEQTWITREGWQTLLQGETPVKEELIQAKDLFQNEPRLGIARNNQTRSALEGKLYQTQHLRLENDVTIELDVKGLNEALAEKLPVETKHEILRLGGEGRMAVLAKKSHYLLLPTLIIDKQPLKKIIIHFITPAYFGGQMFPENFDKHEIDGQTVWQGKLLDIELIIEAAVIGKAHREGGWDMQKHQPRSVKSYIPVGSAWFCRVVTEISNEDLLEKLHGQSIGAEIEWGRGQILIGLWNDTKTQGK